MMSESRSVRAGGFEIPDHGTQAVGRGAAFVAKADDGTAIHHNPAGLARLRGTSVLLNGNLFLHSFEFQRSGQFPDAPQDPETPWGNTPYPVVKNVAGPFFAPFLAATSDFGYFDRWTFAAGVYGPSTIGNRTFPLGVENKPSASRYDFVQSRASVLFPTASAGVRVTPWLDVGLSAHLVLARFDETGVAYVDMAGCKNREYFRCDARTTLKANATSIGATMGAMLRPSPAIAFGASFRTPINMIAKGVLTPEAPKALQGQELVPGDARLALQLPWMARLGGRYIGMDGDFELYDLELDVTYEAWGSAQKDGPILDAPNLGSFKDFQTVALHGYGSTIGVRGGGAYNIDTGEGLLSLRGGAYFDSTATDAGYTRLDFDTLSKVAGTLGVGFKLGSFGFDLGYAAVASIPRLVGSGVGEIRPVNVSKQGQTIGSDDRPLPAVNEGAYRGFTHIVSVGVTVSIEGLLGPPRPVRYGNPYEPNYVGDGQSHEGENPDGGERGNALDAERSEDKNVGDEPAPRDKPLEIKKGSPPSTEPRAPTKRNEWWEETD